MSADKHDKDSSEYAEDRDHVGIPPAHDNGAEKMSVGRYLATRLPSLKPPMDRVENPFKLLAMLNTKQWLAFSCAFIAWTWDAFDFFTVSLTVSDLAVEFDTTTKQVTWGITLVLMFRSVGAVAFGLAADRYGKSGTRPLVA